MIRLANVLVCIVASFTLHPVEAIALKAKDLQTNSYSPIASKGPTLAPFQHVRFCLKYPNDCQPSTNMERITLMQETMSRLQEVNREINARIVSKQKVHEADFAVGWTISPMEGDCNDYAVTKRHALLKVGFPVSALRLAVVKTSSGMGHLVLVISTQEGDLVMDNLNPTVLSWKKTNYDWIKIQSDTDPKFWTLIQPMAGRSRIAGVAP